MLFVVRKLTTEGTKEILHRGHRERFIYGKGTDLKMPAWQGCYEYMNENKFPSIRFYSSLSVLCMAIIL